MTITICSMLYTVKHHLACDLDYQDLHSYHNNHYFLAYYPQLQKDNDLLLYFLRIRGGGTILTITFCKLLARIIRMNTLTTILTIFLCFVIVVIPNNGSYNTTFKIIFVILKIMIHVYSVVQTIINFNIYF